MKIDEILKQPEGRKIEFKEELPSSSDINKTAVAFANDAGGEIFIGIKDNPREVVGVNEDDLIKIEEIISNSIHDNCSPVILPEIIFRRYEDKHLVVVKIYKGSNPPYHLKAKGEKDGTYIRVGSSNRIANSDIIAELVRQRSNVSFDSLPVLNQEIDDLSLDTFKEQFEEKTSDKVDKIVLSKLNLFYKEQGTEFPTNALVLLSDDKLRNKRFPYAKIECARFKGIRPGNFIDQKTIDVPVSLQPEQAYQFVLRHISQGSDYEGVYRKDRWEYPVIAIREVIRNAVIHRDYALTGKDIKIAVFDDKIEITSPGKLLPTVDFNEMDAGQSDIRNITLAPVFKKLGIIEQWGNGLQLIAENLKQYPEIELKWNEPGIAFRVSFIKKNFIEQPELQLELEQESGQKRTKTDENGRLTAGKTAEKDRKSGGKVAEKWRKNGGKTAENHWENIENNPEISEQERIILKYLLKNNSIKSKDVEKLFNIKDSRARLILKQMVDKDYIEKQGKGRNTYYILATTDGES
ncbi:MAG: putative DNA binding domain-containing protein [Candidatus Marinimicrobia bacterium]|nr:putative DNA binding domain-containing protein [Candidatus Neomarinimicrobiota bacterium]